MDLVNKNLIISHNERHVRVLNGSQRFQIISTVMKFSGWQFPDWMYSLEFRIVFNGALKKLRIKKFSKEIFGNLW